MSREGCSHSAQTQDAGFARVPLLPWKQHLPVFRHYLRMLLTPKPTICCSYLSPDLQMCSSQPLIPPAQTSPTETSVIYPHPTPANSSASDGGPTPPHRSWAKSPPNLAQCHPCHQHPGQLHLLPQPSASEIACNKVGSASTLGSIALDESKSLRIRLPAPPLTQCCHQSWGFKTNI